MHPSDQRTGNAPIGNAFAKRLLIRELDSKEGIKRLWWLHDSFWHASLIKELGVEAANRFNLEANEKIFRMLTLLLLRERIIKRPASIRDLMEIFRAVWKNAFFDDLYIHEPIEYRENTAIWTGTRCHAFDTLKMADILRNDYQCGCQALRNGVMKALRLRPLHRINESLVNGDGRCVIEITFAGQDK
jgi:hypothetical protein